MLNNLSRRSSSNFMEGISPSFDAIKKAQKKEIGRIFEFRIKHLLVNIMIKYEAVRL